jgi:hypothetical protein
MAFVIAHRLVAALGQPIEGNAVLTAVFGTDAQLSGSGHDDRYLAAPAKGLEAAANNKGIVTAIFLKAAGVENFAQYAGELPNNLSFIQDRAAVRGVLGEAALSGEAGGEGIMAIPYSWDRYEDSSHYLRVEYAAGDASIRMITIGRIEA